MSPAGRLALALVAVCSIGLLSVILAWWARGRAARNRAYLPTTRHPYDIWESRPDSERRHPGLYGRPVSAVPTTEAGRSPRNYAHWS